MGAWYLEQASAQGHVKPLNIDAATRVLVLTGAGVSAESGVPTFRGADGLWEKHRFEEVASPEAFARDPALVWRFYSQRREGAARCTPNAGHHALAALEAKLGDRFLLATQNVDGLHPKAGSKRMVELHGNLFRTRCSSCERPAFEDFASYAAESLPRCDCGALLRPDIVWFGEYLNPEDLRRVERFFASSRQSRFLFLAIGTSGTVYPAAGFVRAAREWGAETHWVNPEPPSNSGDFQKSWIGPSGDLLPRLLAVD